MRACVRARVRACVRMCVRGVSSGLVCVFCVCFVLSCRLGLALGSFLVGGVFLAGACVRRASRFSARLVVGLVWPSGRSLLSCLAVGGVFAGPVGSLAWSGRLVVPCWRVGWAAVWFFARFVCVCVCFGGGPVGFACARPLSGFWLSGWVAAARLFFLVTTCS